MDILGETRTSKIADSLQYSTVLILSIEIPLSLYPYRVYIILTINSYSLLSIDPKKLNPKIKPFTVEES